MKSQESTQRPQYCNILSKQLIPCIWYAACSTGQTKEGLRHSQTYGMIKADLALIMLLFNLLRHEVVFISGQGKNVAALLFFPRKCIWMSSRVLRVTWCSLCLHLISPHLYRCLRTTGAVSLHWERMMRSHAGGCAVAATSRPWQRKTAATQTTAPNPHRRSRHDVPATWRPHSRPSQRWPRSSKCVLGKWFFFIINYYILISLFPRWCLQITSPCQPIDQNPKILHWQLYKTANPHI